MQLTRAPLLKRNVSPLFVQESKRMAECLGWRQGQDEIEPSMCIERIQGMFQRAKYYKAGKVTEKDSGKPFIPHWDKLQNDSPMQATLAYEMVCMYLCLTELQCARCNV